MCGLPQRTRFWKDDLPSEIDEKEIKEAADRVYCLYESKYGGSVLSFLHEDACVILLFVAEMLEDMEDYKWELEAAREKLSMLGGIMSQ